MFSIKKEHITSENYAVIKNFPSDYDAFENSIIQLIKSNKLFCVILFDIDNLEISNSILGWDEGNKIIIKCAEILQEQKNSKIQTFRLFDDKFALIYENVNSKKIVLEYIDFIFSIFISEGISVSAGVSLYPTHASSFFELIEHAYFALCYAKFYGKENYFIFEKTIYSSVVNQIQIRKNVFTGLKKKEFALYFQPQYYLHNHKLRGFEALIRWQSKEGWLSPFSFIPEIEKTNTMRLLGDWILENAIMTLGGWQKELNYDGILSVNISPIQIQSEFFFDKVTNLLKKYSIKKNTLELEITESIFISDIAKTSAILKKLQLYGVKVALDDFGTGYSSLRCLTQIPLNTIKFDKTFIDDFCKDTNFSISIISSLLPIMKKAGIETIAEGVENSMQLCMLADIACSCIQGYIWGKPMPLECCKELIEKSK